MRDVTTQPHGATCGIMGWPYPGHSKTLWKLFVLKEGLAPDLALDGHVKAMDEAWEALYGDVKAVVLEQLRAERSCLSRWAESMDWLQTCGRGDVVAVLSRHSGAVLSHCCLAWREDYCDVTGGLWNWEWVLAAPDPSRPGRLLETRADASGCILDKQGLPTSKSLVRPDIGGDERDGILARWQSSMGEALRDIPPVRTVLVEQKTPDWGVWESEMAAALKAAVEGSCVG